MQSVGPPHPHSVSILSADDGAGAPRLAHEGEWVLSLLPAGAVEPACLAATSHPVTRARVYNAHSQKDDKAPRAGMAPD